VFDGAVVETEQTSVVTHLAFVGSVVPDGPDFWGPAFSRSGNMWQENLLGSLQSAGMTAEIVLSQRPLRVWPRDRHFSCRARQDHLTDGTPLRLLGFANFPILRRLTVGVSVMLWLWRWGRSGGDGPRIVLCYNLTDPQASWILRGAQLARATAIAMVCDVNVPGQTLPDSRRYQSDWHAMRRALPRFDGLLAISPAIAADLAPEVPALVVEGGLSQELFDRLSGIPEGGDSRDGAFEIVAAGSLLHQKGFHEIVRAFGQLDGRQYRLHIAGWGPLAGEMREAARRDSRITFHGMLDMDGMLRLYASASVVVNMLLTKAIDTRYFYPSKTWELLASGVPLITTLSGPHEHDWADFIFPVQDETASGLAEVFRRAEATPWEQRAAMGRKARSWIASHGLWPDQGARIAAFMWRVAQGNERAGETDGHR
jgi:glycosyltransferase involved in cell wall biosynthesis